LKKYLNEILYLLGDDRRKLPVLILMFLGISLIDLIGLSLVAPYISLVLDQQASSGILERIVMIFGLSSEHSSLIMTLGLVLMGVFFLKAILALLINYKIIKFSQEQQVRLRSVLMQAYQSMPYEMYLQRNSSEYIYSIQGLVSLYSGGVLLPFLRTLSDGIVAIVILSLLAFENHFALALLVGLFGILIIVYDSSFRSKIKIFGESANTANTAMVQGIREGIEGLKEIRILKRESHFYRKVRDEAKKSSRFNSSSQAISTAPRYLLELLMVSFIVILVTVSIMSGQDMQLIVPTIGLFGIAGIRLLPSANILSSSLIQMRFGRDAVSRLYNDIKNLSKTEYKLDKSVNNSNKFQTLSLDKVSFCYPEANHNALNEITMTIKAGESIGIIGASAAGKSTLVDVMLGLLKAKKGDILYNGQAISKNISEFYSRTAYLPQQVFLIDNTLRCNIALGVNSEEINDERVNESIQQAFLGQLVEQLPQGAETIIGEGGARLSGGQRQRVALARAFYHGRDILIMDEATSALDNETEREIVKEIKKYHGVKTIIVIAHRLSTVQNCDVIYRLDKGRIVEFGTPEQVINKM